MVALVPFDPVEFVMVAESLAATDSSEADLRTAVGRLYYAAMLTARDTLGVAGGRRVHGRVIGELRRHDKIASIQLGRLHDLRALADYDTNIQDPLKADWRRNYNSARNLTAFVMRRLADIRENRERQP